MHADFKIRVDIRGEKAAIAWRCRCQAEPNSEAMVVDALAKPDQVLAWFNKLLNDHRACAKPTKPETLPMPEVGPPIA